MSIPKSKENLIGIEEGAWYYFTVDLDYEGFVPFQFVRYIDVNGDRMGAVVELSGDYYFRTRKLILLPYTQEPDYFRAEPNMILSVWTIDGSKIGDAETVDVKSKWPRNVLDKAAITPSIDTAIKWTKQGQTAV